MNEKMQSLIQGALMSAKLHPCILCGKTAEVVGLFTPGPQERLPGEPPGKERSCLYRLCLDCTHRTEEAETYIRAEIIGGDVTIVDCGKG